jgi:hypothetical protein
LFSDFVSVAVDVEFCDDCDDDEEELLDDDDVWDVEFDDEDDEDAFCAAPALAGLFLKMSDPFPPLVFAGAVPLSARATLSSRAESSSAPQYDSRSTATADARSIHLILFSRLGRSSVLFR